MSAETRCLFTVEEAARRLAIGRTTLFQLLKRGEIASIRIGSARRIPSEALDIYVSGLSRDQAIALP